MHGSGAFNQDLVTGILDDAVAGVETVLCPPYPYLTQVGSLLQGSNLKLGAQNVALEVSGAFTGEVAAEMLSDVGCQYVIVGHSERRTYYHEDNALVAGKFAAVRRAGLTPILCVGETREQRDQDLTRDVVGAQLDAVLKTGDNLRGAVIAYEPVWAIGTGLSASPKQAQEVHAFIRARIPGSDELPILYGGSLKPDNAAEMLAMQDIDGGLIGGASLDAGQFLSICKAAVK